MPVKLESALIEAGRSLLSGLVQIFYPNLCWLCRDLMPPERRGFCGSCHSAVFTDPFPACPNCAATVGPFGIIDNRCPTCRAERFSFDRAFRIGPYVGGLRDVVLLLKQGVGESLAEIVGAHWTAQAIHLFQGEKIDTVVPVPLHWKRRWHRGYNQSAILAAAWAKALHVPIWPRGLRRVRDTKKQFDLPPHARRENVRGAFEARSSMPFRGRHVLLVDDVMTTGGTVHESAAALRKAGTARIVVAVMARA
jgi:ComF family protein